MALNEAKQYGHRVSNAINVVDKPDNAPSRAVALSATETKQLLVAAEGDPLEALYVLAVTLGIRQGELLALRWQDIDFESRPNTHNRQPHSATGRKSDNRRAEDRGPASGPWSCHRCAWMP